MGVARRGQQQALFAPNANDPEGAVTISTHDGTTLRSSVLALAYFDTASGRDVVLATVQDAVGELLPPNRVLYRNAFVGLIKADLIYEYRKTGVQQVVLLSESPPDPEEFGLLAEATRLEVLSEFFEPPTPARRSRVLERVEDPELRAAMAEPDWMDESLDFGLFRMAEGQAFRLGDWLDSRKALEAISIGKRWTVDPESGRTILFESADYWSLAGELARLPAVDGRPRRVREARTKDARAAALSRLAALQDTTRSSPRLAGRSIPPRSLASTAATSPVPDTPRRIRRELLLASGTELGRQAGLVLDWTTELNSGRSDFVFQGDTTYFITGSVGLSGTNLLEGGTVLKYADNLGSYGLYLIDPGASLRCQTAPGRPAVFTSMDDNTVGELIPGSSGNPSILTNVAFLRFYDYYGTMQVDLQHIRVAYALVGVVLYAVSEGAIGHAQFVRCGTALELTSSRVILRNVLVHDCTDLFMNSGVCDAWGEHVTLHQIANLFTDPEIPVYTSLANSLLVAVTNLVTPWTLYTTNSATLASDTGVFQAVGSGAHYLAAGSPYRNAGTTNLNAELAADLKRLTTYPPIALSNITLNTSVTWGPQAIRDTDVPDLGYHYSPLDYAVDNVAAGVGGQLSLLPGTAIGTFGCYGLVAEDYGKITALGSPLAPVRFAHYTAIQEPGPPWGCTDNAPNLLIGPPHDVVPGSESPEINLRFVEFTQLGGRGLGLGLFNAWFAVKSCRVEDCQFYGCGNHFAASYQRPSWIELRNNLFHRTANEFYGWVNLSAYNNLFWGGNSFINSGYGGNPTWYFHDNAFHGTGLNPNVANEYANLTRSHNAYLGTGQATLNGSFINDVTLTNFAFSSGPLGPFCHTNTSLVNVGSRTREQAGLYHFTVMPGINTKEGTDSTNVVDIGFHYAGVNASSLPLDTDGDGLPDWYEDRDGNSSTGTGETDWQTSGNGTWNVPGLHVFSPLE